MRITRDIRAGILGAIGFGLVFAALSLWYVLRRADQLTFIGLVTLPTSLIMFALAGWIPSFGKLLLYLPIQMGILLFLGCIQYGALGLALARMFKPAGLLEPRSD
jgi:hypothetical protein